MKITKLPIKKVSISGVHGVGKTTLIHNISQKFNLLPSIERPQNPFLIPYEAMLFFIAAFSWRDKEIISKNKSFLIDRWSIIDISVYIKVLYNMRKISKNQYVALVTALNNCESNDLIPDIAILLDDEPNNILKRIELYEEPSKHHIFERDFNFITLLRNEFLFNFKELSSTERFSNTKICILQINGKNSKNVLDEATNILLT